MVKALRDLGVEARGIVIGSNPRSSSDDLESYSDAYPGQRRYSSLSWLVERTAAGLKVLEAIRWADVVHYHFGGSYALPLGLDVEWARALGRRCLIYFWGHDIRIAEVEARNNPYFARSIPLYDKWMVETPQRSRRIQAYYARRGFTCLVGNEFMYPYISTDLFPTFHLVRCAIDTQEVQAAPLDPPRGRVVIVHSPSHPVVKGTSAVLAAVETLKKRGLEFDFVLIQGTPRQQALELLKSADIFLDQFVLGGYGMASIEAMAMGKPVVCYIRPSLAGQYPPELPIVNATQDNLVEALEKLIRDAPLRAELGRRGRAYVEKYHDARKIAQHLKGIYEELLLGRQTP